MKKRFAVMWRDVRAGDIMTDFVLVERRGNQLRVGENVTVDEGAVEVPFTNTKRPNYRIRADGHDYIGPGDKRVVVLR